MSREDPGTYVSYRSEAGFYGKPVGFYRKTAVDRQMQCCGHQITYGIGREIEFIRREMESIGRDIATGRFHMESGSR
jgi:hypothetical protein